jgi:hypothetical protein
VVCPPGLPEISAARREREGGAPRKNMRKKGILVYSHGAEE